MMKMSRVAFPLVLGMATILSGQDVELKIGAYYALVLPPGCQHWWVMPKAEDAVYATFKSCASDTATAEGNDPSYRRFFPFVQYNRPILARVLDLGVVVALISTNFPTAELAGIAPDALPRRLASHPGEYIGWVSKELLKPRSIYDQTAFAASERAAAARQREEQAKEQAYVAALPKLMGPASGVVVATSKDCARDYAKLTESGRMQGTGVEFRRKLEEFMRLGCGLLLPSGTPIIVSSRDSQFVEFSVYNGPRKGTRGVAFSRDVTPLPVTPEKRL